MVTMTNFDFLKSENQFAAFADACIEAENSISVSPALCALGVRKSAELAVKWLYSVDRSLRMPYKDNFSALVYNQSFLDTIDEDILDRLKFIIKLGNFSAHTSTKVTYKEAVLSLANLFDFVVLENLDYVHSLMVRNPIEMILYYIDTSVDYESRDKTITHHIRMLNKWLDFNIKKETQVFISPLYFENDENIIISAPKRQEKASLTSILNQWAGQSARIVLKNILLSGCRTLPPEPAPSTMFFLPTT